MKFGSGWDSLGGVGVWESHAEDTVSDRDVIVSSDPASVKCNL